MEEYCRFSHLNDFELNDVLLLEANNKGNLIFQHLELFVLDSKATSFFQLSIPYSTSRSITLKSNIKLI